jgi:hypothetical protein
LRTIRVYGRRVTRAFVAAVALVVVSGCGSRHADRSVLFSGTRLLGRPPHVVTDGEAARRARELHADWLRTIRGRARRRGSERFVRPRSAVLRARLRRAASAYGLRIRSVRLRRPKQLAPDVVLESDDFVRASRALGAVVDAIDPPPRSNAKVYEAVFVELVDDRGVPYAIAFDALRGHVEGGQWARAESLYPFAHG